MNNQCNWALLFPNSFCIYLYQRFSVATFKSTRDLSFARQKRTGNPVTDQTILIVEDDPKVRALLRNVLEDEGFSVREAEATPKALEIVRSKPFV